MARTKQQTAGVRSMTGAEPEGTLKAWIREGKRVLSVVVVADSTHGGLQFFPFVRLRGCPDFIAIRKARSAGLVGYQQFSALIGKLRQSPEPGISGGLGWAGTDLRVVFPGAADIHDLGPAAEQWRRR